MRIIPLALGFFAASVSCLTAQVTVEVVLDQEQFLRDESLPVKLRIANRSGQTLQFGKEKDWVSFHVEGREGVRAAKLGEVELPGEFTLESAMVATRRADLMPYFDLSRPGRYVVRATLKIKEWNEEIVSKPAEFDIIRGTKIFEQEFGVPGTTGAPEARKYILQQATFLKRLQLYARVTDLAESRVFRVTPIGPLVSFSKPEAQLDKQSNLHVLVQTGARSFIYTVVAPDGELAARQTHDYTSTRPVLRAGEDGKIKVAGGVRRPGASDLPPPQTVTSTNDVKIQKP